MIDGSAKILTDIPPSESPSVPNVHPRIVKSSDVCGGEARVAGTRLTVSGLEEWRLLGWDDQDLVAAYPDLSAENLEAAREYAATHREEIQAAIRANREA